MEQQESVSLAIEQKLGQKVNTHDTPHIPAAWSRGVFILGESAYHGGTNRYEDIIAHRWVPRYLEGSERDQTYSKVANAIGPSRVEFWNAHAFANLVILPTGSGAKQRPTPTQYRDALDWLRTTMLDLQPSGVWIWGVEQSQYSAPVIANLGIPYEVATHPACPRGITHAYLAESWTRLITKIGQC